MSGIFISYRHDETDAHAGWLRERLAAHFGDELVFTDLRIGAGEDFVERIDAALETCDVLLAVIGRTWVDAVDADGRRRLEDPGDFVSLEVQVALERSDVRVVPVLVQGARMPTAEELPPAIRALARRQAVELTRARWDYDCAKLIAAIEPYVGPPPSGSARRRAAPATSARTSTANALLLLAAILVAAIPGYFAYLWILQNVHPDHHELLRYVRRVLAWVLWWGIVGAGAGWAASRLQHDGRAATRSARAAGVGVLAGVAGGAVYQLLQPRPYYGAAIAGFAASALVFAIAFASPERRTRTIVLALAGAVVAGVIVGWVATRDRTWDIQHGWFRVGVATLLIGAAVAFADAVVLARRQAAAPEQAARRRPVPR